MLSVYLILSLALLQAIAPAPTEGTTTEAATTAESVTEAATTAAVTEAATTAAVTEAATTAAVTDAATTATNSSTGTTSAPVPRCEDKSRHCDWYKSKGKCDTGCKPWTYKNCKKTCDLCGCTDLYKVHCLTYRERGYCKVAHHTYLGKHVRKYCKKTCDFCTDEDGGPDCKMGCENGVCESTDNCRCDSGWEGEDCSIATCNEVGAGTGCINGECNAPNKCTCEQGWEGDDCSQPICSYGCVNGVCSEPDKCECEEDWSGRACTKTEGCDDLSKTCRRWTRYCTKWFYLQREATKNYFRKYCAATCNLCPSKNNGTTTEAATTAATTEAATTAAVTETATSAAVTEAATTAAVTDAATTATNSGTSSGSGTTSAPDARCTPPTDTSTSCTQWVTDGYCKKSYYKKFMMKKCMKSCDYCNWKGYCIQGGDDHTMCMYEGKGIGSMCTDLFARESLTDADKKEFLDGHNTLRQKVASGNQDGLPAATEAIPDLQWDDDLAKVAQTWLDQCDFNHDKNRITEKFQVGVGQNLYLKEQMRKPTDRPWKASVDEWYKEVTDYLHYKCRYQEYEVNPPCLPLNAMSVIPGYGDRKAQIGHFTAVIWAKTTHVGCGYTRWRKANGHYMTLIGCNYGEGGNVSKNPVYV